MRHFACSILIGTIVFFLLLSQSALGQSSSDDPSDQQREVSVSNALALTAAIGVIPLFIGLTNSFLSNRISEDSKGFVLGVAFGIMIFSLIDLFGGASRLGIDFGLRSVHLQFGLLLAFGIGLLIPFALDRHHNSFMNRNVESHNATYTVVYLFALAVAFHSFAEGVVVGFDFQSGYSFTFAQQSLQGASFFLHKVAEGIVISVPLIFVRPRAEVFVVAGIIGSIPLLIGISVAYLGIPGVAASIGFALGAGTSTFVLFRLGQFATMITEKKMIFFAGIIVGLLFMYFAGWIHSVEV